MKVETFFAIVVFAICCACFLVLEIGYQNLGIPHLVIFLASVILVAPLIHFFLKKQQGK